MERLPQPGTVEMFAIETIRNRVLWAFLALSSFAAIEPSPYDLMFLVALVVFAKGGLRFEAIMAPLIVTLLVYNAGGVLALTPWVGERESVMFIVISIYISLTTFLFAAIVAADPSRRMATIKSGYIASGVIAAILGIVGYFNIAGLGPYFTLYDNSRAMGAFKDPNVFAPYLVPPIVWLCQDILLGRARLVRVALLLGVMILGVLLSFSRGAIIDFLASAALLLGLTFLTTPSPTQRLRTVKFALLGAAFVVLLVVVILAIPTARDLALERASLVQDYDGGQQGRFGNQVRSIPMLLDLPFGFGPLRFGHIFPQDPHEVFISAFASCGWLGGLAFAAFIAITLYLGTALCFRRSPLQSEVIGLWAALAPQILQGVQIDTSHWRHLFLMCGCLYGLAAAERMRRGRARASYSEMVSVGA